MSMRCTPCLLWLICFSSDWSIPFFSELFVWNDFFYSLILRWYPSLMVRYVSRRQSNDGSYLLIQSISLSFYLVIEIIDIQLLFKIVLTLSLCWFCDISQLSLDYILWQYLFFSLCSLGCVYPSFHLKYVF